MSLHEIAEQIKNGNQNEAFRLFCQQSLFTIYDKVDGKSLLQHAQDDSNDGRIVAFYRNNPTALTLQMKAYIINLLEKGEQQKALDFLQDQHDEVSIFASYKGKTILEYAEKNQATLFIEYCNIPHVKLIHYINAQQEEEAYALLTKENIDPFNQVGGESICSLAVKKELYEFVTRILDAKLRQLLTGGNRDLIDFCLQHLEAINMLPTSSQVAILEMAETVGNELLTQTLQTNISAAETTNPTSPSLYTRSRFVFYPSPESPSAILSCKSEYQANVSATNGTADWQDPVVSKMKSF